MHFLLYYIMLLLALKENKLISIHEASRKKVYICPECKSSLVVRGGYFRKKHFYHLQNSTCRHKDKSILHEHLQENLKKNIPSIQIEHYFPTINRIGDAVWLEKKIVFEIQCSFIARELIEAREQDYFEIGYNIVWILSDHLFNRYFVNDSELRLRKSLSYYTNIGLYQMGFYYDQRERFKENLRLFRGTKLKIDLTKPQWRGEKLYFWGDQTYMEIIKKEKPFFRKNYLYLLEKLID